MVDRSKYDTVVVTAKGWDGTRVLGAFKNYEEARDSVRKLKAGKIGKFKEEMIFDFLMRGSLSSNMTIEFNTDPVLEKFELTFRYHEDRSRPE